jgi:hypothetical protein
MNITKHPIPLKDGTSLPAGSEVSWSAGKATVAGRRVSALGAAKALGIESPTDEELNHWVCDSIVDSVLGYRVEPDGCDEEGSPSWLLALGLI